jgi:hypothetical protein
MILFVGNDQRASVFRTFVQDRDWTIYIPDSVSDALSMHRRLAPDIVIIEMSPGNQFSQNVYDNLIEFGTRRMILLTHDPNNYTAMRKLSRKCKDSDIADAITELMLVHE